MRVLFLVCVMFCGNVEAQRSDFKDTDFWQADSTAALYPKHSLRDLKSLASKLTANLATEQEKFRAIFKWVCDNIESDYKLYRENKRMRAKPMIPERLAEWNRKFCTTVFNRLLSEQKTVCSGYAYLVRELSLSAGLACHIIDGYARTAHANIGGDGTPNHSWNAVKLNGKWYLCDATWSSGVIDGNNGKFQHKFDDAYFLPDPSLFVLDHYPLDTAWVLSSEKYDLEKFLNGPVIYPAMYRYRISEQFPERFEIVVVAGAATSFYFTKKAETRIESLQLVVNRQKLNCSVYTEISEDGTELYCLEHVFQRRGLYTVHVLLNSSHVMTYSVRAR